jgi:D-glycero-D-manno-heptose 1,7-bisphosphate phosphatase
MKILFCDIDGTLTETISGHTFKQSPTDVKIIEGADRAIAHFATQGWVIMGVSNQAGIASGFKTLDATVEEMKFTLDLFPQLELIMFCPDFEGKVCAVVNRDTNGSYKQITNPHQNFRKPNPGMIKYGLKLIDTDYATEEYEVWMAGDRPQDDEQCAINAGINFCPADVWRDKFKPGIFTHKVTPAQLEFLEGVKLSGD